MSFRVRYTSNEKGIRTLIGGAVRKEAERAATAIVNNCVALSPVRTGAFRAAWNVSEGVPVYKEVPKVLMPGTHAAPVFNVKATTDFPKLYITNGQPYAARIEDGWSGQAPHGVMRLAVQAARVMG